MNLPVAILCGGMGTRLYPLTQHRPKSLVEVLGEPFLAHQLRLLKASGIERVVLCTGHYGENLRDYTGDGKRFGLTVDYSFDGPVLLGTGGAIRQALPLLGSEFFVLYGDSYLPCDYQAIANRFHRSEKQALMSVFQNEGQWDSSNVEMSDEGTILAYDKKNPNPRMRHIDYGLGAFCSSAFSRMPANERFDLADLYGQLLADGELCAYPVDQRFYEIGSLEGIKELTTFLSQGRDNDFRQAISKRGR
jgi:N-acetyl-alpha-D-muramate 1-phosphate uridylyltransferase